MKTLSKKIIIYVICGLMIFSVVSTSYYKSVHAMEWVGGALAFEEALKWLLASIGIVSAGGMTADYWENHSVEFEDYCIQQNITNQEVTEWEMKLCEGILDKSSECWSAFKSWAQSLINSSGGSSAGSIGNYEETIKYIYSINGGNVTKVTNDTGNIVNANRTVKAFNYYVSNGTITGQLYFDDGVYTINDWAEIKCDGHGVGNIYFGNNITDSTVVLRYNSNLIPKLAYRQNNILYNITANENIINNYPQSFLDSGNVADENFQSVTNDVADLDVISDNGVDEADPEVSLPYPGLSDSDNIASKDTYDNIIDAINDGTITIDEGIERIQEIIRVITYDTVTDDVIPVKPDPDTGENKKKDDVIKENKENASFGLNGLQNIFPFCIPFDIYAFMNLLVADPVAPEFDFPIKSVNGKTEQIHVDLEPFEPVAVVVRYVFDFLFIVGLGLMTRSMIGGGGSD